MDDALREIIEHGVVFDFRIHYRKIFIAHDKNSILVMPAGSKRASICILSFRAWRPA